MGQITTFDLNTFINKHKIKIYFETGTGECVSLEYAHKYNFETIYSVDLDSELYNSAVKRFGENENIILINDYSTSAISQIIPNLDKNTPILFFLDAHFPGADFHKMTYEESIRTYKEQAFPLEDEIKLITSLRDCKNDVFIIDDFVLYDKNSDYESIKNGQTWQYEWLQKELNISTSSNFIYDIFSNTHNLEKDYRHQGYLIITPKN